jgi:putative ABC transport system substrate-binding protein
MLQLLQVAVPEASIVGVLMSSTNADHQRVVSADLPPAAQRLGLTIVPIEVKAASELDAAFERAARERAGAIVVLGNPVIYVHRVQIAALAAKQRLPAMYFGSSGSRVGNLRG